MPAVNGDSTYFDGAIDAQVVGSLASVLHPREGKVLVLDLDSLKTWSLGSQGYGPGDISRTAQHLFALPGGMLAILDQQGGLLQFWDTAGRVLSTRRVEPVLGVATTGLAVDAMLRAYIPREVFGGDTLRIRIDRFGAKVQDSLSTPLLETAQPIFVMPPNGFRARFGIPHEYTKDVGALFWAVDDTGLIYVANGSRLQVDTVRPGGRRGTWFTRDVGPSPEVPEDELKENLRGISAGGRSLLPSDVMPARYAQVVGLFLTDSSVWIARGSGISRSRKALYDVVDRRTRQVRSVYLPRRITAISDRWAVGWSTTSMGELRLDVIDLTANPDSSKFPTQPAFHARAGSRRPPTRDAAARAAQAVAPPPPTLPTVAPPSTSSSEGPPVPWGGCSIGGRGQPGVVTIDITVEGRNLTAGEIDIRVDSAGAQNRRGAEIWAGETRVTDCRGRGHIRFNIGGRIPPTLSLRVTGHEAAVVVLNEARDTLASEVRATPQTGAVLKWRVR